MVNQKKDRRSINVECQRHSKKGDNMTKCKSKNQPRFEKDIVCPGCGVLTMDEVELTELGQTQLGTVFMAELE